MSMTEYPSQDFRYFRNGEYSNRSAIPRTIKRSKIKIERTTKTCPSCGMKRSSNNKCFCNED